MNRRTDGFTTRTGNPESFPLALGVSVARDLRVNGVPKGS